MSWLRASTVVAASTLASRVLGFLRDVLMAQALGAGVAADAFLIALKIPNLLRRLFAEGAFSAAFVPLFSQVQVEEGTSSALALAGRAMTVLSLALLALTGLALVAMPLLIGLLAPGFDIFDPRRDLAIELTRRTFPYVWFISLAALLAGVLNVAGSFALPALVPVILNLVLIAALLLADGAPAMVVPVLALALPIAGILQLAALLLACRMAGVPVVPRFDLRDRRIRLLGRRILPGLASAGIYQINVVIVTIMATALAPGAVSFLYFADRLAQLPLGLIGVAISTALLPLVARRLAEGRFEEAKAMRNQAVEVALLLTLPAAAGLTALALPIVQILFGRGAFDLAATAATATALQACALGLPAAVLVRILAATFFARGDMRTPLLGAAAALVVNLGAGLAMLSSLEHLGLAIAASLGSWANLLVLSWRLGAIEERAFSRRTKQRAASMLACAAVCGSLGAQAFEELGRLGDPIALGSAILVAALGFFAMVTIVRAVRPKELTALLRDRA
ncbi:MAG TPA: murein biosynthesis integral membrane protein MurJ [Geminicoccus sp.]|uniref:murein biosynthesis integral membrane protein MurJ n=1 Tax=Geminicoccus sp. TaxID=2024832 RepID=UPI002E33CB0D|nr:murein biosynthesis integral membrane protein MurJ [Geminicoccus sp.]HEX2526272.1 murein biosynthesis integral membrane protein MurJ [Geminicoccus sp.]